MSKIGKELWEGQILGPSDHPLLPSLQVSPLSVVPKKAPREYWHIYRTVNQRMITFLITIVWYGICHLSSHSE